MYSYIRGKFIERLETAVVVEAAGVGYYIEMGRNLSNQLGELGSEVTCYVHFNISQYDQRLFGFPSKEHKQLFELLISVNGVGPKAAVSLIDEFNPSDLAMLIVREDVKTITARMKGKGFGKKSAERVVLELKDKFKNIEFDDEASEIVVQSNKEEVDEDKQIKQDLLEGLSYLGYQVEEAKKIINNKFNPELTLEENLTSIIKSASK